MTRTWAAATWTICQCPNTTHARGSRAERATARAHLIRSSGPVCLCRFVEALATQFQQQHAGKDLRSSPAAMLSLLHAVEAAKCALSSQEAVTIRVPGVLDGGSDWTLEVTRAQFNEIIAPKLRVTLEAVDKALKDGKVTKQQVDQIVLAGGSTRQFQKGQRRTHSGDARSRSPLTV